MVDNWNDPSILPSTIRLYSKKVPVRDTTKKFEDCIRRHYNADHICERLSENFEKYRFSQQEWCLAREQTSSQLDHRIK